MRDKRRSKSVEPAFHADTEGYASLALYCEVKLQEALAQNAAYSAVPGRYSGYSVVPGRPRCPLIRRPPYAP